MNILSCGRENIRFWR